MKTHTIRFLIAGLALSAGSVAQVSAANPTPALVTVTFQDPEHFTDVRDRYSNLANMNALEELRECVQQTAARLIPAGSKLAVTFIDVDLAGMIRPDKDNIRVMTGTTLPRANIKFQLVDAGGKVLKEGERKLVDLDYQQSAPIVGRSDPLFYDKQLLKNWLSKEFKSGS